MTLAFVSAVGVRDDLLTDNTIVVQHNGNWSRALGDNRRLARGRERTLVATKG
jgi:hypothetical protein